MTKPGSGKYCLIWITGFVLLLTNPVNAQYLKNPSLEDEDNHDDPPNQWETLDSWSNPNIWDDYTPPGTDTEYKAVDGNTFALFRSRGATYSESFFEPYQREYIFQKLLKPLETHSCFVFKASMCYNPHHLVQDTEYPDTALPLKFQVWGGMGPGDRSELLVDTDPIDNTSWEEFTYYFSTRDISYTYLLIEVQFDTLEVFPRAYNGYILVDNLKLDYGGTPDTIAEHTLYYKGDNVMTLSPDNRGASYYWFPEQYLSNPNVPNPLMTQFTEDLILEVGRDGFCPDYELFHFILDCDTLYPDKLVRQSDFYFKYEEDMFLEASDGNHWLWDPATNLSSDTIQSPQLQDFYKYYKVIITDRYDCEFQEEFNIIANCDTLFPGGTYIAMDSVLTEETEIELQPVYGRPVSLWEPTRYMSCQNCVYQVVTPQSSTSYAIDVVDRFDCRHTEYFNFEVVLNIPNVITPYEDGYNDCFQPFGVPPNATLHLFNKAGRQICSIPNFTELECWSGTDAQNKQLKTGTYWYAFETPEKGTIAKGYIFIKQ